MTISYTIETVDTDNTSVDLDLPNQSAYSLQVPGTDKDGANWATYVHTQSNLLTPTTVTYRTGLQKRGSQGTVRRMSATYTPHATMTDSVTGAKVMKEIPITISINVPADFIVESDDLEVAIHNAFGLLMVDTAGVKTSARLAKLALGIPTVLS